MTPRPQHHTDLKRAPHTHPQPPTPLTNYPTSPLPSPSILTSHSGGEEVLLDVGGQDATEAFEDVGHSDEAREILDGLLVGTLQRVDGDPAPKAGATDKIAAGPGGKTSPNETGFGVMMYVLMVLVGLVGYGGYVFMQGGGK